MLLVQEARSYTARHSVGKPQGSRLGTGHESKVYYATIALSINRCCTPRYPYPYSPRCPRCRYLRGRLDAACRRPRLSSTAQPTRPVLPCVTYR